MTTVVGSVLNLNMDWRRVPKSLSKSVSLRSLDEHDEFDAECQSPFNEILSDHCISQLLPDERYAFKCGTFRWGWEGGGTSPLLYLRSSPKRCEYRENCFIRAQML